MANNNPAHIVLRDVRLSYTHLFEAYANQPGQEPKYSSTILVPKASNQKILIDAAIVAATQRAVERYGNTFPRTPKTSVHDGDGVRPSDGQPFGEECKGCWVFTASSKERPKVVDLNLQPILDATEIYSGMHANVGITFFGYNAPQNKGIGVGLENVQKVRDGEALGSVRASADEDFVPVSQTAQYGAPITQQPYAPATQQPVSYTQQPTGLGAPLPAYQPQQYGTYQPEEGNSRLPY